MRLLILAALVAGLALPASAQNRATAPDLDVQSTSRSEAVASSFAGTTVGRPTFTRPSCTPANPTDPATQCAAGANVPAWEEHPFTVSAAGTYTLRATWTGFDGYLLLYRGSFDPVNPRTNLIGTNDDDGASATASRIDVALVAGQVYTLVATGFFSVGTGAYTGSIDGPTGSVTTVVTQANASDFFTAATTEGTFQRPVCPAAFPANPAAGCTLRTDPVAYTSVQVVNYEAGIHQIRSTQAADGFLYLYAGGFDPANPRANLVAANDDDYNTMSSKITYDFRATHRLSSGTPVGFYTVVAANFSGTSANAQRLEFRRTGDLEHAVFQDLYQGEIAASSPTMPRVTCSVNYTTTPATQCTAAAALLRRYSVVTVTPTGTSTVVPLTQAQQFDGLMHVYRGSFDPAAPLVNLIATNDDGTNGVGTSDLFVRLTPGQAYSIVTQAFDASGLGRYVLAAHTYQNQMAIRFIGPVAAEDPAEGSAFSVAPLAPNPTATATRVVLTMAQGGNVRLAVFDALGRRVAVLAEGEMATGTHAFTVDASALAPGVYVVRAEAGGAVATRMLTVVR